MAYVLPISNVRHSIGGSQGPLVVAGPQVPLTATMIQGTNINVANANMTNVQAAGEAQAIERRERGGYFTRPSSPSYLSSS